MEEDLQFEVDDNDKVVDQYLTFHDYATKKYGPETLVVYQQGEFYEQYAVEDDEGKDTWKGADLKLLRNALNYTIGDAPGAKRIGIRQEVIDPCIRILQEYYKHIIRVDQVSELSTGRKVRRIVRVYTKETHTDSSSFVSELGQEKLRFSVPDSDKLTYLSHAFVRIYPCNEAGRYPLAVGIATMSVEEGQPSLYQTNPRQDLGYAPSGTDSTDGADGIEEAVSYLNRYCPKLVLLTVKPFVTAKGKGGISAELLEKQVMIVINRFNELVREGCRVEVRDDYKPDFFKIDYQEQTLEKMYKTRYSHGVLQSLGLERKPEATVAFVLLVQYLYDKYRPLVEQLHKPEVLENANQLFISSDGMNQLSLYDDINGEKSLYDIINHTKTAMGGRLLLSRLLYPLVDAEKIETRYSRVEYLVSNDEGERRWQKFEPLLDGLPDLDKYHRKFALGSITPENVLFVLESYKQVLPLRKLCLGTPLAAIFPSQFVTKFKELREALGVIEKDVKLTRKNRVLEESMFVSGYDAECDSMAEEIDSIVEETDVIMKEMESRIKSRSKTIIKLVVDQVKGLYCYNLKKADFSKLKQSLRDDPLVVSLVDDTGGETNIHTFGSDSFATVASTSTRISVTAKPLRRLGKRYFQIIQDFNKRVVELYKKFVRRIGKKYSEIMHTVSCCLAEIDFYYSLAKTATKNKYCRPQVRGSGSTKGAFGDEGGSYLRAINLRHPIIEQEIKHIYVPHSLQLGRSETESKDQDLPKANTMLIYAANSTGKSTLLRSVGVAVMLAQMGSYVPAEEFEYIPFDAVYTRILTKDNIHKSRSSFQTEMLEMTPILKQCTTSSLVLADEPCHSTNYEEQVALVKAFLRFFGKKGVACLMATHIYRLADSEDVTAIPGLSIYNLAVRKKGTKVLLKRQLQPGVGLRYSAVDIARECGIPEAVVDDAERFRKQELGEAEAFLSFKKSNYSSKLYMDKTLCEVCGKRPATETHHILPQKDADKDGFVRHVRIHALGNLQRICEPCHKKITAADRTTGKRRKE